MRKVSSSLTLRSVPRARRLSSCGSKGERLMSDGSKSVVGPMYCEYRSCCRPSVRLSSVTPPKLAISSIRELLAAVLERLGWWCLRLRLSDLPGELGWTNHMLERRRTKARLSSLSLSLSLSFFFFPSLICFLFFLPQITRP